MRHTFFAGIFFLGLTALQAQAPGYMGKKFTIGYGFYFHPSFTNTFLDYGDSPFNIQHELFAEAVTGKKFLLGASAHFYKFVYNNREGVAVSNYSSSRYNDVRPTGTYIIRSRNYSVYAKAFKGNYLAPWGKYFQFGLVYTKYTTEYDPSYMQVAASPTTTVPADFGPPLKAFQTVDLVIGNGRSRIIGNRIVLDYGYTLGLASVVKGLAYYAFDSYYGYEPEEYISKTSGKRIAAMNRFNFYVKLGYLF